MTDKSEIIKIEEQNSKITNSDQHLNDFIETDQFIDQHLKRHVTFMQSVFGTESDKQVLKHQAQLIEQASNSRLEKHRMFSEFQRQAIQDSLDGILSQGKANIRGQNATYYTSKAMELQNTLDNMYLDFTNQISTKLGQLETIENETLRRRREEFLYKMDEDFLSDIGILIKKFRDILKEGV